MALRGSYRERLIGDFDEVSLRYAEVLDASAIRPHNWDRGFIGFPHFYWDESSPELQVRRMSLLADVKDLETRVKSLVVV